MSLDSLKIIKKKPSITEYSDSTIVVNLHILWRYTTIISSDMWQLSMPYMLIVLAPYFYTGKCDHKDIVTKQLALFRVSSTTHCKPCKNKVGGSVIR